MSIYVSSFKEPIYTRRNTFNHDYDITLNEITKDSNNNSFSDNGYAIALLDRLKVYGYHEKKLFLKYQLNRSSDPLRWLLDFERLVELNNWKSAFEFFNFRAEELNTLLEIFKGLFVDIDKGNYDSKPTTDNNDKQKNNQVIFNSSEACSYLNISKSTLYKLTSSKSIAFYKPNGKNMYFKKEALDSFITQSKQISNSELETQTNNFLSRDWKL